MLRYSITVSTVNTRRSKRKACDYMPILLCGLDICSLPKRNIHSLDFTVNRVLMKLFKSFKTSNIDVINDCIDIFDIKLPSVQLSQRFDVFIAKWVYTVSHKKRSQLSVLCNFVKCQQILMTFSLLDL